MLTLLKQWVLVFNFYRYKYLYADNGISDGEFDKANRAAAVGLLKHIGAVIIYRLFAEEKFCCYFIAR